jgi:hypothetical protein
MTSQSLHDSVSSGTYGNPRHAVYAALLPESGAFFGTLAGEAKTIAQIFLALGDGLSGHNRRLALAHPCVSFNVRGDWTRAPSPADFDRATLRWGIGNATDIAVWSAPFPQFADDVARWGIDAADGDGRFVTIIDTVPERAAEWSALVRRWKKPTASLRFFGPESAVQ